MVTELLLMWAEMKTDPESPAWTLLPPVRQVQVKQSLFVPVCSEQSGGGPGGGLVWG